MSTSRPPDGDASDFVRNFSAEDTLGGRMSLARDAAGLSATQAASQLGVMTESWNVWERDRDAPHASRLADIAEILGISLSWLVSGEGEGPHAFESEQASRPKDVHSPAAAQR